MHIAYSIMHMQTRLPFPKSTPDWIDFDLSRDRAEPKTWPMFRAKVHSLHENGHSIHDIVKMFTKTAKGNPKNKSVVPFIQALLHDKKTDVECLVRAKCVAAVAAALDIPVTVIGNETHVFVELDSKILDFNPNLAYRDLLRSKSCHKYCRQPSYYSEGMPLGGRDIIATTLLNDDTPDKEVLLMLQEELYPGTELARAPVWVRAFIYEQTNPELIMADDEARSHPFIALDFAKTLKSPGLLRLALSNLQCTKLEYDKAFFFDNDDDVNFYDVFHMLLSEQVIPSKEAQEILKNSIDRAEECLSKSEAKSYTIRCGKLEEEFPALFQKDGKRKRK